MSVYAVFENDTSVVDVRVGVSFISVEQARDNLDREVPDGTELEETARRTRGECGEMLDRFEVEGAGEEEMEVFYTGLFHALQVRLVVMIDAL